MVLLIHYLLQLVVAYQNLGEEQATDGCLRLGACSPTKGEGHTQLDSRALSKERMQARVSPSLIVCRRCVTLPFDLKKENSST